MADRTAAHCHPGQSSLVLPVQLTPHPALRPGPGALARAEARHASMPEARQSYAGPAHQPPDRQRAAVPASCPAHAQHARDRIPGEIWGHMAQVVRESSSPSPCPHHHWRRGTSLQDCVGMRRALSLGQPPSKGTRWPLHLWACAPLQPPLQGRSRVTQPVDLRSPRPYYPLHPGLPPPGGQGPYCPLLAPERRGDYRPSVGCPQQYAAAALLCALV